MVSDKFIVFQQNPLQAVTGSAGPPDEIETRLDALPASAGFLV